LPARRSCVSFWNNSAPLPLGVSSATTWANLMTIASPSAAMSGVLARQRPATSAATQDLNICPPTGKARPSASAAPFEWLSDCEATVSHCRERVGFEWNGLICNPRGGVWPYWNAVRELRTPLASSRAKTGSLGHRALPHKRRKSNQLSKTACRAYPGARTLSARGASTVDTLPSHPHERNPYF